MTAHVRLPGTNTTRVSTVDSAGLSLTGDLDVRACLSMDDWTPGAIQSIIGHWNSSGNVRSWQFSVNTAGTLFFQWSVLGTSTVITSTSTVATGFTDATTHWVRVTHDVDNGAVGNDVAFYYSDESVNTAAGSVTWTQLGTTVTTAAVTSHFDSTAAPAIGALSVGGTQRIVANFYYAELRSSIGGTIVGSPDFRTAAQITTPNTVFTDSIPNAWTLQSDALWEIEAITGTGASTLANISSAGSGTYSVTPITGTGASTLQNISSAGVGVFTGTGPAPVTGTKVFRSPRYGITRRASQ